MNSARSYAVLVLALSLLGMACKRSPKPSPEFEQAQRDFSALYGRYLDDAYSRPEMTQVEDLLHKVPSDSLDAGAAQALLKRIEDGRAAEEAALREREAAAAQARAPIAMADEPAPPPAEEKPAEVPDAGPSQPVAGMSVTEFKKRFGDCFDSAPQVLIRDQGMKNAWQLQDRVVCRQKLPDYATKVVIEDGTKVLGLVDKAQIQQTVIDGGANR